MARYCLERKEVFMTYVYLWYRGRYKLPKESRARGIGSPSCMHQFTKSPPLVNAANSYRKSRLYLYEYDTLPSAIDSDLSLGGGVARESQSLDSVHNLAGTGSRNVSSNEHAPLPTSNSRMRQAHGVVDLERWSFQLAHWENLEHGTKREPYIYKLDVGESTSDHWSPMNSFSSINKWIVSFALLGSEKFDAWSNRLWKSDLVVIGNRCTGRSGQKLNAWSNRLLRSWRIERPDTEKLMHGAIGFRISTSNSSKSYSWSDWF